MHLQPETASALLAFRLRQMVSSSRGRGCPDKEFTGYRGAHGGGSPSAYWVHPCQVTNDRSRNLSAIAMPHRRPSAFRPLRQ